MAYPLVSAFVVLPTASRASVCTRTSCGRPDISAMPPALSVMGPYVSMATIMPVTDSMATAAMAMPYRPARLYAANMATAMTRTGRATDCMPTARPEMMLVAGPVSEALATRLTGAYCVAV